MIWLKITTHNNNARLFDHITVEKFTFSCNPSARRYLLDTATNWSYRKWTASLSAEVQAGLDNARARAIKTKGRLCVHMGDAVIRISETWDNGFALPKELDPTSTWVSECL